MSKLKLPLPQSERLTLRPMGPEDAPLLAEMLTDARVMYAWEKTFSPQEIDQWIANQQKHYEEYGAGYLLAISKETGLAVGQIGLLQEDMGHLQKIWGIGYLLNHKDWGKGYAREGAAACAEYAFTQLDAPAVYCDIRPQNQSSMAVAKALGMVEIGEFVKHYDGKEMTHIIFELKRESWQAQQ